MHLSSHSFTSLSFFDLDHTLLTTNSSFCFGKYLYKQGVFSTSTMIQLAGYYSLHKAGLLSISSLHHKTFTTLFLGRPYSLFASHAKDFVENQLFTMLYLPAIQELHQAELEGNFISILSSSPDFLVGLIAKQFGVKHWKGSEYSLDDSKNFSHISALMLGEDKAKVVQKIAKESAVLSENITAYSDNILDLPFLQSAGKRVAVNPDRQLYAISKQNNWKII